MEECDSLDHTVIHNPNTVCHRLLLPYPPPPPPQLSPPLYHQIHSGTWSIRRWCSGPPITKSMTRFSSGKCSVFSSANMMLWEKSQQLWKKPTSSVSVFFFFVVNVVLDLLLHWIGQSCCLIFFFACKIILLDYCDIMEMLCSRDRLELYLS